MPVRILATVHCVLASRDNLALTESNAGTAEAEEIKQCLHQAQEAALDETHGGCLERCLCGRCCDGRCGYRARTVLSGAPAVI